MFCKNIISPIEKRKNKKNPNPKKLILPEFNERYLNENKQTEFNRVLNSINDNNFLEKINKNSKLNLSKKTYNNKIIQDRINIDNNYSVDNKNKKSSVKDYIKSSSSRNLNNFKLTAKKNSKLENVDIEKNKLNTNFKNEIDNNLLNKKRGFNLCKKISETINDIIDLNEDNSNNESPIDINKISPKDLRQDPVLDNYSNTQSMNYNCGYQQKNKSKIYKIKKIII